MTIRINRALSETPKPQAILILDGDDFRIKQAANFSKNYPDLPIWMSGYCSRRGNVPAAFAAAEVLESRIYYDLRATDTVTHFTTLVDDFVQQDIRHVYVITSDYHMSRAKTIATIIFGSHGIAIWPVKTIDQRHPPESWLKIIRDGGRAFLWVGTGYSGERFNPRLRGKGTCKL